MSNDTSNDTSSHNLNTTAAAAEKSVVTPVVYSLINVELCQSSTDGACTKAC